MSGVYKYKRLPVHGVSSASDLDLYLAASACQEEEERITQNTGPEQLTTPTLQIAKQVFLYTHKNGIV